MRVLAVDPGGVTGFAYFHPETGFDSRQKEGYEDAANTIYNCVIRDGLVDVLVCEGFTIRSNTHKLDAGAFNQTTDLIGACRLSALLAGIPFVRQSPGDAKSFSTDAKLRRLGWYNASPGGHANDAARHLLKYLASKGHRPTLERLTEDTP